MIRLMIIPATVLTLFTAVAGQAAVLKGVVLAEELGGPPAAGVEIVPTEGAAPVVTDAGGAFTLVFPDKQAGDTVLLTVRSEGREVVNCWSTNRKAVLLCCSSLRPATARK